MTVVSKARASDSEYAGPSSQSAPRRGNRGAARWFGAIAPYDRGRRARGEPRETRGKGKGENVGWGRGGCQRYPRPGMGTPMRRPRRDAAAAAGGEGGDGGGYTRWRVSKKLRRNMICRPTPLPSLWPPAVACVRRRASMPQRTPTNIARPPSSPTLRRRNEQAGSGTGPSVAPHHSASRAAAIQRARPPEYGPAREAGCWGVRRASWRVSGIGVCRAEGVAMQVGGPARC